MIVISEGYPATGSPITSVWAIIQSIKIKVKTEMTQPNKADNRKGVVVKEVIPSMARSIHFVSFHSLLVEI